MREFQAQKIKQTVLVSIYRTNYSYESTLRGMSNVILNNEFEISVTEIVLQLVKSYCVR